MTHLLTLPVLLAQLGVPCGMYGASPSSPGGCYVPSGGGSGVYLQQQPWMTPAGPAIWAQPYGTQPKPTLYPINPNQ
jgi:hypothetical protein